MKLFGKKEKKACCAGNCSNETMQQAEKLKKEAGIKETAEKTRVI